MELGKLNKRKRGTGKYLVSLTKIVVREDDYE